MTFWKNERFCYLGGNKWCVFTTLITVNILQWLFKSQPDPVKHRLRIHIKESVMWFIFRFCKVAIQAENPQQMSYNYLYWWVLPLKLQTVSSSSSNRSVTVRLLLCGDAFQRKCYIKTLFLANVFGLKVKTQQHRKIILSSWTQHGSLKDIAVN